MPPETVGTPYAFLNWMVSTILTKLLIAGHALSAPVDEIPASRWQRMFSGTNVPHGFTLLENQTIAKQRMFLSRQEIRIMRQMGIRNVRLPFVPEAITTSYDPPILDPAKVANLRRVLEDFKDEGILVQLDLHDGTRLAKGMGTSTEPVKRLKAFWRVVATELKDFDPEFLAFEVLSEPVVEDGELWWSIQKAVISEIRSIAPKHTIIAQAAKWAAIDETRPRAPYSDKNVIYTFHFYDPFIFTHQGAKWVGYEQGAWRGILYPTREDNLLSLRNQITSPNKQRAYDDFAAKPWNAARIRDRIKLMADWAKKYDAKITCNEFGTLRESVDSMSRATWLRDVRNAFEEFGIGWSVYEWRGGMGMHYGEITAPGARSTVDWRFIDALGWKRPNLR
ncbi:MAG: cellulase family glycosylhydrolase [Chthonomonas sp.]|nr:cellulase family glycosylhydrolase [Chthonomonas sp.]